MVINVDKSNALKVQLLTYSETINVLKNRLDSSKETIQNNMYGFGKMQIIEIIDDIMCQLQTVNNNIISYISLICSIENFYRNLNNELSSALIRNINKLDNR